MSEMLSKKEFSTINRTSLLSAAYGINGAGGGGNVLELHNPKKLSLKLGHSPILGLTDEIGERRLRLVTIEDLPEGATVASIARLGSPGAKADNYAKEGAQAAVIALEQLAERLKLPFPSALFPVEATAGQLARTVRPALAASQELGTDIAVLDGDVCGGMAVPSVPLAFGIFASMKVYPTVALVQLIEEGSEVKPSLRIFDEADPAQVEAELRTLAGDKEKNPLGAVWFAWMFSLAKDFNRYFTPGSVSNSMRRGAIVREAVEKKQDPAQALLEAGEIISIVARGNVISIKREDAKGFSQFSYRFASDEGELQIAARNEYIVVIDAKRKVVSRAPYIINLLGADGPIQSHMLQLMQRVSIVEAVPQCLINEPGEDEKWRRIWNEYWRAEQKNDTWNHPY